MRNYLIFMDKKIAFTYPEDRTIDIGTNLLLDIEANHNQTARIQIKITKIEKQDLSVHFYCERV